MSRALQDPRARLAHHLGLRGFEIAAQEQELEQEWGWEHLMTPSGRSEWQSPPPPLTTPDAHDAGSGIDSGASAADIAAAHFAAMPENRPEEEAAEAEAEAETESMEMEAGAEAEPEPMAGTCSTLEAAAAFATGSAVLTELVLAAALGSPCTVDMTTMKVEELRGALKTAGCDTSGKRAELVSRLVGWLGAAAAPATAPVVEAAEVEAEAFAESPALEAEAVAEALAEVEAEAWALAEVEAEWESLIKEPCEALEKLGLDTSGRRVECATRLVGAVGKEVEQRAKRATTVASTMASSSTPFIRSSLKCVERLLILLAPLRETLCGTREPILSPLHGHVTQVDRCTKRQHFDRQPSEGDRQAEGSIARRGREVVSASAGGSGTSTAHSASDRLGRCRHQARRERLRMDRTGECR